MQGGIFGVDSAVNWFLGFVVPMQGKIEKQSCKHAEILISICMHIEVLLLAYYKSIIYRYSKLFHC